MQPPKHVKTLCIVRQYRLVWALGIRQQRWLKRLSVGPPIQTSSGSKCLRWRRRRGRWCPARSWRGSSSWPGRSWRWPCRRRLQTWMKHVDVRHSLKAVLIQLLFMQSYNDVHCIVCIPCSSILQIRSLYSLILFVLDCFFTSLAPSST